MKDKTDDQWKSDLSEEQYSVLRQGATEAPFSGSLLNNKEDGGYHCSGCDNLIFESGTKFDSGSGWPSFTESIEGSTEEQQDLSHGMVRTEVKCTKCNGHLGHVFNDGPDNKPRYCINSVCLDFKKDD